LNRDTIIFWLKGEFAPIALATSDITIGQKVDNAFRYWNSHSALRIAEMYDVNMATVRIQLSTRMSTVAQVKPSVNTMLMPQDSPIRSLLGISVVDYMTPDLIQLYAAYQMYSTFMSTTLKWTVEDSLDPSVGPTLYLSNVPQGATALCVIGTRRFDSTDNITEEHTLDWILKYSKALVKQTEGNALRKTGLIDVKNDGQALVDEGKQEQKELEDALALEGRWLTFAERF
jgi:hypothetical protein